MSIPPRQTPPLHPLPRQLGQVVRVLLLPSRQVQGLLRQRQSGQVMVQFPVYVWDWVRLLELAWPLWRFYYRTLLLKPETGRWTILR